MHLGHLCRHGLRSAPSGPFAPDRAARPSTSPAVAGEEGFEPPHPVLETGGLPLNLLPSRLGLLHFAVRRVLAARSAKLPRLHPVGMLLSILRGRVIPVLAIGAFERNDF